MTVINPWFGQACGAVYFLQQRPGTRQQMTRASQRARTRSTHDVNINGARSMALELFADGQCDKPCA